MLQAVAVPKWVFTNADVKHAERCLDLLGIRDCFQVCGNAAKPYHVKPNTFRHTERCLDLPGCRDSTSRWPRTQLHLNSDPKAVKHTVRCLNKLEIRDWDFQVEVSQS